MKYLIKEAGSMIGALVKESTPSIDLSKSDILDTQRVQIVIGYRCDAKGEWIRFITDAPDAWRILKDYKVVSRKKASA